MRGSNDSPRWVEGLALAGLVATLWGCAVTPQTTAGAESAFSIARIADDDINESSGLVRSRTHPDVFWTHNDSGDSARIFAITADGRTLAEFAIEGAEAVDWEDITIDDAGNLYLGDVGNNENRRRDLAVYRVPEPDPAGDARTVSVDLVLRYRYADQREFPEPDHSVFDAEAIFWWNDSIYIFTKHRTDPLTTLYRLPVEPFDGERALAPIVEIDVGWSDRRIGNVTAADITPDGRTVALLTYTHLQLFEVAWTGGEPALRPLNSIEFDPDVTRQAESICWDDGALLMGNEQKSLFRIADPRSGPGRLPPDTAVREP